MAEIHYLTINARREHIVEAVIELCAHEEAPASLTTNKVAWRMGISQRELFQFFSSKEAIWQAVVGWAAKQVMRHVDTVEQDAGSSLAVLEAMFTYHVDFIAERPGVSRLLLGQLQRAKPTSAGRMVRSLLFLYRERLETFLHKGKESGELRSDLDVEMAAVQFISTVQGLVIQSLINGDASRIVDQAPSAFTLYRRGIQAGEGV